MATNDTPTNAHRVVLASLALVASLVVIPNASAHCSMNNAGTIVHVLGNANFCGDCTNTGTIVAVGSWDCQGECVNTGIVVGVGRNCFTDPNSLGVNACYASTCAIRI